MTKVIAQTYNIVHEYRRRISTVLILTSLMMVFFYIINVYSVVSNTVAIQKINSKISAIENIVDDLDVEYLALTSQINLDSLDSYGMTQGKVSEYISRVSIPTLGITGDVSHVAYEQL